MNVRKVSGLIRPLAIDRRSIAILTAECSTNPRRIWRNTLPQSANPQLVTRDAAVVSRVALKLSYEDLRFAT